VSGNTYISLCEKPSSDAVNSLELASIKSLVAFTAYDQKVNEQIVRETVLKRFGVDDVAALPSKSFDEVIRFLVDLQAQLLVN
jgi:hypothetical protein